MSTTADRIDELRVRAARLREHSLRSTTEAGSGHPSSCLSAAELIAALFFEFMRYDPKDPGNPSCDRFVLSKGHAAPILYAAWSEAGAFPAEKLATLRRIDSELEGHPTPHFSGTVAATGSLGQGLSVGFGVAWGAKHLDRSDQRVFVLLGDGEMAEGSVWEAAALAAHYKLDNLVAIVDVNGHGQSQHTMLEWRVDEYANRLRGFGWEATTIDGHDMAAVVEAYQWALGCAGPAAIVAKTVKGKGVAVFETGENWHGKPLKKGEQTDTAVAQVWNGVPKGLTLPAVQARGGKRAATNGAGPLGIEPPSYEANAQVATREAYGTALAKLGKANPLVVGIDGDTKNSTFAERLLQAKPEQYLEGFIAEQNNIGAGVGLSASGKIPFVSTFACFHTRAFDQIRMAAISRANLKVVGSHCGVSIGEDGPSQMGLEDIAMMRAVPGSVVLYPSDAVATERLVAEMANLRGIQYLRCSRPKSPILYRTDEKFPIGGLKVVRSSDRDAVTVVAAGVTLWEALKAHDELKAAGIAIRVVDLYSVKPLDAAALIAAARQTGDRILTVEDHYYDGGLGDAVLNAVAGETIRVFKLAVTEIPRSGKPEELVKAHGIDAGAIAARVRQL